MTDPSLYFPGVYVNVLYLTKASGIFTFPPFPVQLAWCQHIVRCLWNDEMIQVPVYWMTAMSHSWHSSGVKCYKVLPVLPGKSTLLLEFSLSWKKSHLWWYTPVKIAVAIGVWLSDWTDYNPLSFFNTHQFFTLALKNFKERYDRSCFSASPALGLWSLWRLIILFYLFTTVFIIFRTLLGTDQWPSNICLINEYFGINKLKDDWENYKKYS